MGYLLHILAAVGVLGLEEWLGTSGLVLPAGVLLLVGLPYVLADVTRRLGTRGRFRALFLAERLQQFSGVLTFAIAVLGLGWIEVVRRVTSADLGTGDWPSPALALAFAPFVLYQLAAIDAGARIHHAPGETRRRVRAFQMRMLLFGLAPVVLYGLVAVAIGASDTLRVHIERVELVGALFMGVLLVCTAALLPALIRNTWETVPLPDGPPRQLFHSVAARAEFQVGDLLLWNTGSLMANAAILGLPAQRRTVLLSDSLLASLGPRELASVYAHEIGHSKRNHIPIIIGWTLLLVLGADLASRLFYDTGEWQASLVLLAGLVLWYFAIGWLSRRFELEADLFAMELLGDHEGLIGALERVSHGDRERRGWRHFSTARRVAFLRRAALDEVFRLRFLWRIRMLGRLGLVLGALALVAEVVVVTRTLDDDLLDVDLALGRYGALLGRVEGRDDLDPEYRNMAEYGLFLESQHGGPLAGEELSDSVAASLAAGELDDARWTARLAAWRGDGELDQVYGVLDANSEGEAIGTRELAQLNEPWRGRVAAALGLAAGD